MRRRPIVLGATALLLLAACATRSYRPQPLDSVPLRARAEIQQRGGLEVAAAVPSAEEAHAILGIPVYARGVQPVWLAVTNRTGDEVRFAPVGTDRDYFAPMEVWYTHQGPFSRADSEALQGRLHQLAMPRRIPAGESRAGFVFTHTSPGTKSFNVDLFGVEQQDHTFLFFIDVPGFAPDHAEVDFAGLYEPGEIADVGKADLRTALAELPCCPHAAAGGEAFPLNAIFVGEGQEIYTALLRAGWYEVARPSAGDAAAPRLFGRVPDAVFRLQRRGAQDRNELRAWLAPIRADGEQVWAAQVTHYIGRRTRVGRALLDARRDPDVDDARNYLLQGMWYNQALAAFAWLPGRAVAPPGDFASLFGEDRYFSNGDRVVLWPSAEPVSLLEVERVEWAIPTDGDRVEAAR